MSRLRVGLAHAEPQGKFSTQLGVCEKEIAAAIEAIHDGLIGGVSSFMAKADQIKRHGCGEFKVIVIADPIGELLRQFHMASNVVLQPLHPHSAG